MESSLNIFLNKILTEAAKRKASNIHLTVGAYPMIRVEEDLLEIKEEQIITADLIKKLADSWLNVDQKKKLETDREIVLVKAIDKKFRLRINFFFQKNVLSVALRIIPSKIPPLVNLGLPKSVYSLTDKKSGLIIVSGPYGSGRTTTISAMIEEINKARKENIVTIEKPIEYLFINQKGLVEQREVGTDVNSYVSALESAQQSDVDVLGIEANNEPEAIPLILEFASSGRLCFLGMDTNSVIQSIEEIFASFKADDRQRAQLLLSESLLAAINQRLLPRAGGGMILASEVLIATEAVQSLIREGRIKQINTILQSSRAEGMLSLDQSLAQLVKSGEVLIDNAIEYANDPENFRALAK